MLLPEDDGPASIALLWALCLDFHAGMASRAEVAAKWSELFEWGNEKNPDPSKFDPAKPASDTERKAASGLLALAGKTPPLRS